jgi:lipoprotein-anchoring transpeptidase ErfK/SrfK
VSEHLAPRGRRAKAAIAVTVAFLLLGIGLVLEHGRRSEPAAAPVTTTTTVPPTTTTTKPKPKPLVRPTTSLASPKGDIAAYDGPGGKEIGRVGFWYGYPMTMPIVSTHGAWLRIRLPERPNGSTAWVKRSEVVTSKTDYRIIVHVGQTKLTVFKNGFPMFTIPVGVGKPATPTPLGRFFVAVIDKPGPPGYGPIVLNTTGHSEAIQSWEGSGDAITAIHGPISSSSDAQIGTTGTRISNGCIRLHTVDQLKLDVIPLGTPVDIVT